MRIGYDPDEDALYLRLDDADIVESEEMHPGIILDFNDAEEVIGVEILRVRRRFPEADVSQLRFDVA